MYMMGHLRGVLLCGGFFSVHSFLTAAPTPRRRRPLPFLQGQQTKKGFGGGFGEDNKSSGKKRKTSKRNRLQEYLDDNESKKTTSRKSNAKPYVKDEHHELLLQLAQQSARTCIGRAVAEFSPVNDPFWELMPSLISSRFSNVKDEDLTRIAGFVRHTLASSRSEHPPRPVDWVDDEYRPYNELHAYMPGLGPTQPFLDPDTVELCKLLETNYETVRQEYESLIDNNMQDKFQSVTSMNYESGWKTLVLFYNGHRIPGFPYHLCPTTTRILETVPLAGRIAGFNRQQPSTGIPLHTDGNNMWLTCQMGIRIPEGRKAYIRVGPETRYWETGRCLLYDTTYEHETFNGSDDEERVVLHVDFFNTLALTVIEIEVMQYIYSLREEFMKAEGVAKVGAHIL
jgi:aspartyl/asparaginyl beta-hydroxylase (cupin superfamily)